MTAPAPPRHGTRLEAVLLWLQGHPGWHRCQDIGVELGITTHQAASDCIYLAGRGMLARRRDSRSSSTYSAVAPPPEGNANDPRTVRHEERQPDPPPG